MSNQNKKQSLIHRIKNAEFGFVKNFKNYIATSVAVVLLALIVIGFFGFNASFDMQKGHTFNVSFGTAIEENEEKDVINIIEKTLENQSIKKYSIEKIGEDETNILVVNIYGRYAGLTDQENWESVSESIENSITNLHTFGALNVSDIQTTSPIFGFSQLAQPLLALVIITAVYVLLSLIRFDAQSMLALIIGALHDMILFVSLTAIFRVQITPIIALLAVTTYLYSMFINTLTFSTIKSGFINQSFEKQTNANILKTVLKSGFTVKLTTTILLIIAGLLLTAIGQNPALSTGFSLILMALVVGYSSATITPSIWALTYNTVNDKKLAKRLEKKANPNKEEDKLIV